MQNIIDGKITGWDTSLKNEDTVIIQIQGSQMLNESNIRQMNSVPRSDHPPGVAGQRQIL